MTPLRLDLTDETALVRLLAREGRAPGRKSSKKRPAKARGKKKTKQLFVAER